MMTHSAFTSCPELFSTHIIEPDQLERHEDPSARALKIRGYRNGSPCFYFHTYSIVENRFDSDDCAYELITYYERAIAWCLDDGHWLRQKIQAHHPVCSPGNQQLEDFEVVDACEWISN